MLDLVRQAAWLLLPPAGFFWTAALGVLLWLRWPRAGRRIVAASFIGLAVLALPATSHLLLSTGQVDAAPDLSALSGRPAAILVLGGDVRWGAEEYGDVTVGALTLERLRYAARLHRRTGLPILASGGVLGACGPPLAAVMRETLMRDFRVPVRWTEERSRNTAENLRFSAEILQRDGISTVVLVTHAWHMRRALLAAREVPLNVVAAPTLSVPPPTGWDAFVPNIAALRDSFFGIHELVGRAFYALVE